jgi:WD40 repeat protein
MSSEDGTVRVWDLRTHKSARCLSRAFGGAPVSSVAWLGALPGAPEAGHEHSVLAAAGSTVFHFDLRRPDLVLTSADTTYSFSSDEVNQVAACNRCGHVPPPPPPRPSLALSCYPQPCWRVHFSGDRVAGAQSPPCPNLAA